MPGKSNMTSPQEQGSKPSSLRGANPISAFQTIDCRTSNTSSPCLAQLSWLLLSVAQILLLVRPRLKGTTLYCVGWHHGLIVSIICVLRYRCDVGFYIIISRQYPSYYNLSASHF